jgi:hypothetical protein
MSRTTAALAMAALALLTACGSEPAGGAGATTRPTAGSVCATVGLPGSAAAADPEQGIRLPAGFAPTAVVECVIEPRPVVGDGGLELHGGKARHVRDRPARDSARSP